MALTRTQFALLCLYTFWAHLASSLVEAAETEKVLRGTRWSEVQKSYKYRDRITVECLNRTIDTGEHITDSAGELQYIPFPVCNETGRPLELLFGSETDINCTLAALTDPLFHLFEFYIHNDAPLSCRIPSLSAPAGTAKLAPDHYTHMQIALTGTLQLSHLHINPALNVILHTTAPPHLKSGGLSLGKSSGSEGAILAATAYSLPPTTSSPRVVIGDPLPLTLSVRWYSARTLPASTARLSGLGGHVHLSTVVYCLLSFGGGVAVSLAYWRGVELPRRMRRYMELKTGGGERGGYAYVGSGKRD